MHKPTLSLLHFFHSKQVQFFAQYQTLFSGWQTTFDCLSECLNNRVPFPCIQYLLQIGMALPKPTQEMVQRMEQKQQVQNDDDDDSTDFENGTHFDINNSYQQYQSNTKKVAHCTYLHLAVTFHPNHDVLIALLKCGADPYKTVQITEQDKTWYESPMHVMPALVKLIPVTFAQGLLERPNYSDIRIEFEHL